jgi:hypothetical protein
MAVLSVVVLPEAWEGKVDRLWRREYSRSFRVVTDSRLDGPVVALTAVDPSTAVAVPRIGDPYAVSATEYDLGVFATDVVPRFSEFAGSGLAWVVTVSYTPYDPTTFVENPLDWPAVYWYENENRDKIITEDISSVPILNKAFERYADPTIILDNQRILYVERREALASYDDQYADQFRNKRNAAAWNNWNLKEVLCAGIKSGRPEYDQNTQTYYLTVVYKFVIDTVTLHNKVYLNQGFSYLDGSSPAKRVRITGPDGQPLSEASLLDSSGHLLASNGTPVFNTHEVYSTVDFGLFNIDLSQCVGR